MNQLGFTVWLTGLPSSGKSTLAEWLCQDLEELGLPVQLLDGDEVRQRLTKGLGFTRADREENISRISYVAKLLTRVGAVAIVAAISPYREMRQRARTEIGRFIEVYVQCPLQVCIARDVKGLYAKALRGEIPNFTGISDSYEPPMDPEIVVATDRMSPQDGIETILTRLARLNYLPPETAREFLGAKPRLVDLAQNGTQDRLQWSI